MSEGCGAVPKSESQVRPNLTSHKYSTNVPDEGGEYAAQAGVQIVKATGFFCSRHASDNQNPHARFAILERCKLNEHQQHNLTSCRAEQQTVDPAQKAINAGRASFWRLGGLQQT